MADVPILSLTTFLPLVGALFIFALTRWRGTSLATKVPAMHFWRERRAA